MLMMLNWAALAIEAAENSGVSEATRKAETHRVHAAQARAIAFGFSYQPTSVLSTEVVDEDRLEGLLKCIEEVQGSADALIRN